MAETLKPANREELREAVAWAAAGEAPLEVVGHASKRGFGRPPQAAYLLDVSALSGIEDYAPAELTLTAGAATPLAEVARTLDEAGQQLAFEPPDWGKLLGGAPGGDTLGGVIACNMAGPRRIKAGAARDHVLGFHAVSGRGEHFKSGGRVVKNVTGFDLSKLMAGSFGTLAVMADVTVKVLPRPEKTRTVLVGGGDDGAAARAMAAALGSAYEVSGAAHLPAAIARRSAVDYVGGASAAVTALRVEGTDASVAYRCRALRQRLAGFGETEELHSQRSLALWREIADVAYFADDKTQLWRVSVPPLAGPRLVDEIAREADARAFYDWGGGLVWLAIAPCPDAGHAIVRRALAAAGGGHATLLRADEAVRAAVPVFQPLDDGTAALTRRIKDGFDPRRVLNPGRMYAGV